jgi:RimJ/RimL family protein N-acetyltransferase
MIDRIPPARTAGLAPSPIVLRGGWTIVEPLDPSRHAEALYDAGHPADPAACAALWRYLPYGPFVDPAAYRQWLATHAVSADPLYFAIRPMTADQPEGVASYLAIRPVDGVLELGHIWFSPQLQRTRMATEALFLLLDHAFGALGYRRVEWKCNALNQPSRHAARRLGFRFEGLFHQHMVIKGRNRDTAWYAILDGEWPALRQTFLRWLDPANFDAAGGQRRSLRG